MPSDRPIQERAAFDGVRYGNVWEDADVLCAALAPVARGGRLLSVASAGDNALALLTLDPAEVVAVDISPAQLACVHIRIAAFGELDDAELLPFLGVAPSEDRLATYRRLRKALPDFAREYWDEHPEAVAAGITNTGRFESYFATFRSRVLPWVHSTTDVERLLEPRDRDARVSFYDQDWDGWRWRLLFRLFFSRFVMGRLGRDPAFFAHVDGPVADRIMQRSRYALTELPTHSNPYLTRILTGGYRERALPRYLRPEFRDLIRERLGRVRTHLGTVDDVPGPFDGFNLSDVFEYMSPSMHESVYSALVEQGRPGTRLVYWNLLAPRSVPSALQGHVASLVDCARDLHARDMAWFYQSLHVDEVTDHG